MDKKRNQEETPFKIQKMDHPSACSSSSLSCVSDSRPNENEFSFQWNPEEKAMSNSLVIRRLMRSLSAVDLLKCRLLNRQWRDEATSVLLLHFRFERSLQISFEWSDSHSCFRHRHSRGTLDEFHALLMKSLSFPCTYFRFVGGNLKSYDSASFFQKNGFMIKSLCLGFKAEKRTTNVITMNKLFYEWVPNIKYLALESPKNILLQHSGSFLSKIQTPSSLLEKQKENSTTVQKEEEKKEECVPLRNLEILDLTNQESPLQITQDIFKVAVNLKVTIDPHLKSMAELLRAEKCNTIKSLSVFEDMVTENIDRFSKWSPKLQELRIKGSATKEFGYRRRRFRTILEDVMESSKDTLEKISQLSPISCLHPMKIPVMQKMKFLVVKVKTAPSSPSVLSKEVEILPPGKNIQEIFPNLEVLHLRTSRRAKGTVMTLNPKQPLPFVHTVHVHVNSVTSEFLEKLSKFCPNVRVLHVLRISMQNFPNTLKSVWSFFPAVRDLQMSVSYWVNPFGEDVLNECDSAITGFSKEVVQKLRAETKSEDYSVAKFWDKKREHPSILDLKSLNRFRLVVQDTTLDSLPLFSKVTALYALNSMKAHQNLIVEIKPTFSLQPVFEPELELSNEN